MGNPWLDPQRARHWTPHGKPGNALRPLQIDLVLTMAAAQRARRVLDLGCGPGEVAGLLLERLPRARVVCLDASPVMLDRARAALAGQGERVRFVQARIEDDWRAEAGAPFDLVLASQAVHHVAAPDKRALYARTFEALDRGGLLLLNEKVAFEPAFFPHMVAIWNAIRKGSGFEPVAEGLEHGPWQEAEVRGGDVPDTVEDNLAWMRAAGFAPVDCLWRHGNQAVLAGLRPAAQTSNVSGGLTGS